MQMMKSLLRLHELRANVAVPGMIFYDEILHKNRVLLSHTDSFCLHQLAVADMLLKDGNTEEAIDMATRLVPIAEQFNNQMVYQGSLVNYVYKFIGLCYIRLGEQLNCILNHSSESCILPIKGKGVHQIKSPMQNAIRVFSKIIEQDTTDLESIWLMNIAYMTLGIYPDSVPLRYLIPIHTFDASYKNGQFKDVAPQLGLDLKGLSGSSIVEDFDNDHDLDIFYVSSGNNAQCHYFVNNGDGSFSDQTEKAGLLGEVSGRTCIQADYNNDGYLDIYVVRGAWENQENNFPPSSLLRNNGDGTFTDVTIQAGLLGFNPSYNAVWLDYNNDGDIDLFVSNESPNSGIHHSAQLFRNNGDGTFDEVAKELKIDLKGWTKGALSFDYNNDTWPDLYICRADGFNSLLKNNGKSADGKITFSEVANIAGTTGRRVSFYTLCLDYNNDGWIDLYTSHNSFNYLTDYLPAIGELRGMPSRERSHPIFYKNNGNGTFQDATEEVRLNRVIKNMGINYGDIDNDGFLDIYAGTGALSLSNLLPNLMLHNVKGAYFEDVTTETGTGNLQKGHGVSFGDIDNDGDQDIYEVMGDGWKGDVYQNVLYENPGSKNHWIHLKLVGVQSNRAAIGARVRINIQTSQGDRNIYGMVSSGGSFGASCLRREMGLADASKINVIEIFWPASGIKQIFKNVQMDHFYEIKESVNAIKPLNVKKISFQKNHSLKH